MMRTGGEFDPIVVSAVQKLRCEHQPYPHPHEAVHIPSEGGACRLLVRLDDGNEPLQCYGNWLTCGVVTLRQPFSLAALGRYRIFALTNNFTAVCSSDATRTTGPAGQPPPGFSLEEEMKFLGWEKGVAPPSLRNLFDDFCDSSVLGMRQVFFPPSLSLPLFECNDKANVLVLVLSSLIRKKPFPVPPNPLRRLPKFTRCFSILGNLNLSSTWPHAEETASNPKNASSLMILGCKYRPNIPAFSTDGKRSELGLPMEDHETRSTSAPTMRTPPH